VAGGAAAAAAAVGATAFFPEVAVGGSSIAEQRRKNLRFCWLPHPNMLCPLQRNSSASKVRIVLLLPGDIA